MAIRELELSIRKTRKERLRRRNWNFLLKPHRPLKRIIKYQKLKSAEKRQKKYIANM